MSRSETEKLTQDGLAFEYVIGTLRDKEREQFLKLLPKDDYLQAQVQFWEEQLIQLSDNSSARPPKSDTWVAIEQRITKPSASSTVSFFNWQKWMLWVTPNLITAMLVSLFFLYMPNKNAVVPAADYIAVLTNEQGEPLLSALTAATKNVMWLKWGKLKINADKNVQLWAVSKRDGQIRPIGVFAKTEHGEITLSKSSLHLVKEAESLILTEEDVGGSAIDEPSSVILAKGVCVLVADEQNKI
jgi:anti-sigma-K factor RskA